MEFGPKQSGWLIISWATPVLEWQVWRLLADISLGHRAWRKANSESTGRARRRYNRPRSVSRLGSSTRGRTRSGPRRIYTDDSGSEEEQAAGGADPGAADPERARSAHSSGWRRYMNTCNGHRGSPQAES
jgi:hypothetical protein